MDDQQLSTDPKQQKRGTEVSAEGSAASQDTSKPFDPTNLVGRVLDGRYKLIKCIGRGGMGVVYLARQSALGRDVVVKLLPPDFADDADALARFRREARGMSKLQHPHIVSIYDFGIEAGQAYIVMEYVAGVTLRRFVRGFGETPGMEFETFGNIALQLLEGLGAAHAMGLVHRDIKPSNIMLTERGSAKNYVKILDFGLAKLIKGAQDITREQGLVGSVGYLSPEQILGHDSDERVDIYALGVLFYYMLAGEKPFVGEKDVAVLYKHVHHAPELLENRVAPEQNIPASVIALIHRMLSKSPEDRPLNAGALLREFSDCVEGTSIQSPHVSGEFRAVSRPIDRGGLGPDDPSSELATNRIRRETPFSQVPIHATPTHSERQASESGAIGVGSGSWVSGEHLLIVERQNRMRNILLGVLGVLILGVAVVFLTQDGRFGASNGGANNSAGGEQLGDSALAAAPEESANVDEDSAAVPGVEAPAEQGRLDVRVEPGAGVFLDDQPLGQSPISRSFDVGIHQVEVRKKGWKTIRREVEIEPDDTLRLDFELEKLDALKPPKISAKPPAKSSKKAPVKTPPKTSKAKKTPQKTTSDTQSSPQSTASKPEKPEPAEEPAATEDLGGGDLLPTTPTDDGDDLLLP